MKKVTIITGAGISAESGISTFRDAGGLWEGHDIQDVATPEGWYRNPSLVLDFYNQRRRQLAEVEPNAAHNAITQLSDKYHVTVVTQNVDDLHERAGNTKIIHLHGELNKARSAGNPSYIVGWKEDIIIGDLCPNGFQMRPQIVWFGEAVPKLEEAIVSCESSDIIIIVGTSMQVYPAAGIIQYAKPEVKLYYIDPNPNINNELKNKPNLKVIKEKATIGLPLLVEKLMKKI